MKIAAGAVLLSGRLIVLWLGWDWALQPFRIETGKDFRAQKNFSFTSVRRQSLASEWLRNVP